MRVESADPSSWRMGMGRVDAGALSLLFISSSAKLASIQGSVAWQTVEDSRVCSSMRSATRSIDSDFETQGEILIFPRCEIVHLTLSVQNARQRHEWISPLLIYGLLLWPHAPREPKTHTLIVRTHYQSYDEYLSADQLSSA